jgi:hypothetical protein
MVFLPYLCVMLKKQSSEYFKYVCLPRLPRCSGRWYRGGSGRSYWGDSFSRALIVNKNPQLWMDTS